MTDLLSTTYDVDTSSVVAVPCATRTTPGVTQFTGITIGKAKYRDIGAACGCSDLALCRIGFSAYTTCKAHGLREAGMLVRAVARNGRPA